MNTTQALFTPLVAPYVTAATILATAARHTWQALRSDRAIDLYRTLSILLQIAGWLAYIACLLTLQGGKAARRYYEAEWATEVGALALRIDRALTPLDGGATLPQADELPQDSPCTPAPDRVVAPAVALDAAATIHPDKVQSVINGTSTVTNKLRSLASLADIAWRHARGKGKHMSNSDIRTALTPFVAAELLAQLS